MLGRLWPVFNGFKGTHHACVALVVAGLTANASVGATAAVVMLAVIWLSRYLSLGVAAGAGIALVTALLTVDDRLAMLLAVFCAALVLIHCVPALRRLADGKEERLSFEQDISYKFDEKF